MEYNEKDDQIFIKMDPDQDAVEFLLSDKVLEFLRAKIVTKDEIRVTVETGLFNDSEMYSKTFIMDGFSILMNVFVYVDEYLRIINKVEKTFL